MNRANLLRVADAIEKHEIPDLGYNQIDWIGIGYPDYSGRGCGTTACIAGWAFFVKHDRTLSCDDDTFDIDHEAQAFLGLDGHQAARLFRACLLDDYPTSAQAVAVLRYAAEHDVVDWSAACRGLIA